MLYPDARHPDVVPGPTAASAFEIRPVAYDLPVVTAMTAALQDYYYSLYHGPDPAPVDPDEFAPPRGMFFVGFEGERPLAMGGWRWIDPLPAIPAARPVEIKRMYVDAAARARGYARAVLARLEATAQAAGADAIVLSTGPPQLAALALYLSSGYADVPKFGFYAAYDAAIHLGKRLPAQSGDQHD